MKTNKLSLSLTLATFAALNSTAFAQLPSTVDDPANLVKHPVLTTNADASEAFEKKIKAEMELPADQVTADPSAAFFPGSVPADAARITREVVVDTKVPDWHSTGLYAAPGEKITVTLPGDAAGKDLGVRIGAHKDQLWRTAKWTRVPQITRVFPLTTDKTVAANAFGGPVYIVVPQNCDLGKIKVTITGGIAAPYFIKGVTSVAEWTASIRNNPAPWAELQGDRVILTVPSTAVRNLDDPQALMTYWDQVADTAADLYSIPHERKRQERYCTDQQISAGYMHSGYPIMTGLDVANTFTNLAILRGNSGYKTWGFYHELGHNHQQRDWTWNGMGEVTNNLLSLYGGETFNQVTSDYTTAHPAVMPKARHDRLVQYIADGVTPDGETANPWLALTMFIDLRQNFGWEPFKAVFGEYHTLKPNEHPKTETAKHDEFMVLFSKKIGKNLGPYFTAWGVTTSDDARQSIANLPVWMPADWPTPAEIATAKAAPKKANNFGY